MTSTGVYDLAVIGGGIVGMATAMEIARGGGPRIVVVEAENRLAAHQSGNNSGVIHSGLYYKPGSLKAVNCTRGREMLYRFCREQGITHERCGKVVVAVDDGESVQLETLRERGIANGLSGLRRLTARELREYEPNVTGVGGLFVAQTGIVDYVEVTEAYARVFRSRGGEILLNHRVCNISRDRDEIRLHMVGPSGRHRVCCRNLVNCGGLYADRIARLCGIDPGLTIAPFRGEYYRLAEAKTAMVNHLIYPVPDPRFPFLGVHFTRKVRGGVEAGPNAVLALSRQGYHKYNISLRDTMELLFYPGFLKMAFKYWRLGAGELYRSLNKSAFTRALRRLVPAIEKKDLVNGGAGVRAQALGPGGELLDDFCIREEANMIHVLNAPSPAATASLNIGKTIARLAHNHFDWN